MVYWLPYRVHKSSFSNPTVNLWKSQIEKYALLWHEFYSPLSYCHNRRRLIQLKLHGIYMLFLIKFWIQNTFKTYSSLFVGLSFQIFLIQITKNFCFTFRHSENSSLAQNQNNNKRKKLTEKSQARIILDNSKTQN